MRRLSHSSFHVLLVEDDPGDATLVRIALKDSGVPCEFHHVTDGVYAMEFLRRQGAYASVPRPQLILLDLNLPRMDGHEVLRQLKDDPDLGAIPVVVLSTSDVQRDIVGSYRLGACSFVTKAVEIEEFQSVIQSIKNYWFKIVQLPG
jgi:CheY-like chemotaxis protein